MSKVIVSEFVTLDGVFQDPGGAEGFEAGGWAFSFDRGPEGDKFKLDEVLAAGALLLGRVTYEGFAEAWPSRADDAGFADKMNSMPKYVVSTTLERADWNNTTIIRGDVPGAVRGLRQQVEGDVLVAGSGSLVQALIEHDLVDEYRLMIFPVVLGTGRRLFPDPGHAADLRIVQTATAGQTIIMICEPAGQARVAP
jgi:dihydrofolate reductase